MIVWCERVHVCARRHSPPHHATSAHPHPPHTPCPSSDIQQCNLDCLDQDAFNFSGASFVTVVKIQQNQFRALPETLLRSTTAVQEFYAMVSGDGFGWSFLRSDSCCSCVAPVSWETGA